MKLIRDYWEGDENVLLKDQENNFYRYIPFEYSNRWIERWGNKVVTKFLESDLYEELIAKGNLPKHTKVISVENSNYQNGTLYQVEKIPFPTAPWEWTNIQLLDMVKFLFFLGERIKKDGKTGIIDFNRDNFTFNFTTPCLLDVGAIGNIGDGYENSVALYCYEFLQDFDFFTSNIPPPKIDVPSIKSYLSSTIPVEKKGHWDAYFGCTPEDYKSFCSRLQKGEGEQGRECQWITSSLSGCKSAIDIGGYIGYFLWPFVLSGGSGLVIDLTPKALANGYEIAKANNLKIAFAKLDVTMGDVRRGKWAPWPERLKGDAVIASSVCYHLYHAGMNFNQQASLFSMIASKKILVEFVDKTDECPIKTWGFPASYNEVDFCKAFFQLGWKQSNRFPHSKTRTWLAFSK